MLFRSKFGPRAITGMHDQAASRISGRTRAAVSAMCVRAVRITVLKSAGNFTRDECHDLNAEKIQPVKCFMFTRCGICCVPAIFERRRGRLGSKISTYGQLAEVAVCFANIFRVAPICPCTVRPSSVPSQGSSMKGRERPCSIRRRLRSSQNVLQRSVELAAQSGRSYANSIR